MTGAQIAETIEALKWKLKKEQQKNSDLVIQSDQITKALYKVSNAVHSTGSLNDLYRSIHSTLKDIIDVTNFYIAIYDKSHDVLSFPYNVDVKDGVLADIENMSQSSSLTGEVIQTKKPLFINKNKMIERARSMNLKVSGTPAELWLGIPLVIRKQVIGAIVVQSYDDPKIYNTKDMDLLVAISDQIAIAIELKQAQQDVVKSESFTQTLFKISNAVNTTHNLDELYQSIYDTLNHLIKLPNFFICIVESEEKTMTFAYYVDEYDEKYTGRVVNYEEDSRFITLEAIKSKKPLLLSQSDLKERQASGTITGTMPAVWLGLPLIIKGKVIGVMAVQHYSDPDYFSSETIDLFVAVTEQVALAVERKQSEKRKEKLIGELHAALEEVKALQGILPICSNCKKIRDDKGYWNLLESYIEKHSSASFSHGMCPECSDKFYGKEDWYIKMKKKTEEN